MADTRVAAQVCPTCGATTVPDDGYCPECGGPMSAPVAAAPAPAPAQTPCVVCGEAIPAGEEWCPSCGAPRQAAPAAPPPAAGNGQAAAATPIAPPTCPSCGATLRPGAKFCRSCGERFTGIPTVAPSPAATATRLSVGQVLAGRYRILNVIGGGGMGQVFLGADMNLTTRDQPEGRPVAVKAILNTQDQELLNQAVEEREMLIRLDHPNIVRIYDIVTDSGVPYIVMAYVKGVSWKEMYDNNGGPLREAEAVRLLRGIRGAFEYLHGRVPPVVYRDFKPGNAIEVTDENGTKRQVLIDLGTATEYHPGVAKEAWGTIGFAPPEIGGVSVQSPGMDLYTIASTLAALLGVDVEKQSSGVPPRDVWAVSQEMYDFVARGRHPDPVMRFATAGEMFDQLEGIARFVSNSAPAAGGGVPPAQGTGPLTTGRLEALAPVQSTVITGRLASAGSGRIGALPVVSGSDPAAPLLSLARELLAAGRYDEALVQLRTVLESSPASTDARILQAAALSSTGRLDEARQVLGELRSGADAGSAATRWRTLLVEAQAAEAVGDLATAEGAYAELARLVPGEVLPKQALAGILSRTGRHDEAAALYERVVAADPANAEAVLGWADSLLAMDRSDDAIRVLDAVGEQAVRYVDAQTRLVELYLQRLPGRLDAGDTPGAREDLALAARALAGLRARSESSRVLRLEADWWYGAYRLARLGALAGGPPMEWPDGGKHNEADRGELATSCRRACRRYLAHAPDAPDAEEMLERIYLDIREWQ